MRLPFLKKPKKKDEEVRKKIQGRLSTIKKGARNEDVTDDVEALVSGLAKGDG